MSGKKNKSSVYLRDSDYDKIWEICAVLKAAGAEEPTISSIVRQGIVEFHKRVVKKECAG